MDPIIDILKKYLELSPVMLIMLYLIKLIGKATYEETIKHLNSIKDDIRKTSLDIKQDLRKEERAALVDFRLALEDWQEFMFAGPFQFAMQEKGYMSVEELTAKDLELNNKLRNESVKTSIYLRDEQIENESRAVIAMYRKLLYPLVNHAISDLIDLKAQRDRYTAKESRFKETGGADPALLLTEKDREEAKKLDLVITARLKDFADRFAEQQPSIQKKLSELKDRINAYIYRPIENAGINRT